MSQIKKPDQEKIQPSSPFYSIQVFSGLDEIHPYHAGPAAVLSPQMQMLTCFGNTLTDMPRNSIRPQHPLAQSR